MKKITKAQIVGVVLLISAVIAALLVEDDTLDTVFGFLSAVGFALLIGTRISKKKPTRLE